jgi:hypothetical protein
MSAVSAKQVSDWSETTSVGLIDSRAWIAQIVRGRSFADVGGLLFTQNEKVSEAVLAGASEATMLDVIPLGHSLWKSFDDRCASRGVSGYKCVSADATAPDLAHRAGPYDVVFCSGVIYHVPDLVAFVLNLVSIAERHLILQSMVVPNRIENEFGVLDLTGGHCLFVPAMNEEQRKIAGKHLEGMGLEIPHLNGPAIEKWVYRTAWDYNPWSWLMTPDFLRELVRTCGLVVIDEGFAWKDRSYSLLCEIPASSRAIPLPPGFSHLWSSIDTSLPDLAVHKQARQSSVSDYSVGKTVEDDASRAVTGAPIAPFAFHTAYEPNPWWEVDLGDVFILQQIVIHNRQDAYVADRAFPLLASTSMDGINWTHLFTTPEKPDRGREMLVWKASELVQARFVRLTVTKSSCLHLRQVQVLGFPNLR